MSANTVTITLTAKDGVSKVFTQIARDGESMGTALKKAATDAERGLDDLGDSAQQAQRPLRDLKDDAKNLGLGIGVLIGGMALAGKSFRDQEIALESMRRGYGDTAAEMERFAEQIQDTTNFSDDAAIASENIFRTLALNYQFSAEQIQQLITISADLAASMGIGLEDAAMRVQAAMRGEAESAEYLGLTLNDTALGIDNMAKSTSDAEKAQIRFNALQEQSAFALGMAQQQADTTYGAMTQLRDSVQDAAQSFGDFLGPLGEVGAFAADNVIQLAAMGLALGQVGKAAAAAGKLLGPVSVGTTTLGAAAGPAAGKILALAAAAGLLYVGYQALTDKGDFLPQSFDAIAEGAENAEEAIKALAAAGETLSVSLGQSAQNALDSFGADMMEMLRLSGEQATFQPGRASAEQQAEHEANMARLRELEAQYGHWSTSAQDVADAETALLAVLTNSGTGRDLALEGLRKLNEEFDKGNISPETYASGIEMLAGQLDAYNFMANQAASETTKLTDEQKAYNFELAKANQTLEQYQQNQQIGGQNLAGEHRDAAAAIEAQNQAREDGIIAMQAWLDIEQQIAGNSFAAGVDVDANAALTETWLQAQELRVQAVRQETIEVERLQAQYAETFGEMQSIATQATDTLDSVFRGIVGNTDAIAQQSQSVMDWADTLIGAAGTYAQIDDLLQSGAITLDEYTAAQGAYNDIAAANASIQQDILSIQTQLAPYVAASTSALAEQFDSLEGAGVEAQLFALGMMDAATSSQALALAQGYIADQDTFGPLLTQAALVNPALAAILDQMGLIEYDPVEGTVSLNGVEESQSELSMLTDAMTQLDGTLATLNAILNDDASAYITDVSGLIHELDGDTATLYANLVDNASSGIAAAHAALMALDGASATAYITTIQQTIGGAGIFAEGGVIPAAAMGRVLSGTTLVGEHGPELLLGGEGRGGMVVPATASSRTGNGWGGDVVVNVYGNVGVDDLTEQITAKLVPALQRAVGINNAAYGGFA